MEALVQALQDDRLVLPAIIFVLMAAVGALWLLLATVHSMVLGSHKEQTRREVAAYVAEGSLTTEQAERLLRAGTESDEKPASVGARTRASARAAQSGAAQA